MMILWAVVAYAIGALSLGYRAARSLSGQEPRWASAYNLGLENALRLLGSRAVLAAFLVDLIKGDQVIALQDVKMAANCACGSSAQARRIIPVWLIVVLFFCGILPGFAALYCRNRLLPVASAAASSGASDKGLWIWPTALSLELILGG
jgi:glycerol-3-phosphate acyltransferase PlsY